jgi:transcriptional regulator with XRE-family HTH domain
MLSTLKTRRLERDVTIRTLAREMGYSPELVSAVERLHVRPSRAFRNRAAAALEVPEAELFPEWDRLVKSVHVSRRRDRRSPQ